MRLLLIVMSSLFWTTTSFAAVMWAEKDKPFVYVMGPIEKSDDKRFSEIVSKIENSQGLIVIASPGGDVDASMKMGRIIRNKKFAVTVRDDTECASSCVMILAAGVDRFVSEKAKVIIHRPYSEGALEHDGYDKLHKRMVESLNEYFLEMNIPVGLVSRMMAIPPHRAEELSTNELGQYMLTGKDPACEQKELSEEAKNRGITVTELNKRKAVADQLCAISIVEDNDLRFFEISTYMTCKQAILKGEPSDIVAKRLEAALERRERIELLSNSVQESCIDALLLTGETKDCPIRW